MKTGARYIAETLKKYGVDHVFYMDAVLRRTLAECGTLGIKRILAHSEKAAAYMADGYSRASGRPAVVMAQSVGAANLAAGLQDARLFGTPLIAVTGRHAAAQQYRNAYQELPHEPMFSVFVKTSYRVDVPEQLPGLLRQTFRDATSAPTRPVHLDVAGNTGNITDFAEFDYDEIVEPQYGTFPQQRIRPDLAQLERAAAGIRSASRPVIVAGAGVVLSGAENAVRMLAEKASIPVVGSLDAKAIMVDDHPLFGRIVGTYSCSCANKLVVEADAIIFIGCDASDQVTNLFTLVDTGKTIVQIDADQHELGRNFGGTIGIHADPKVAVEMLAEYLPELSRPDWVERLRALKADWDALVAETSASDAAPIRPERICSELSKWLPDPSIFVADTGYSSQWTGTTMALRSPGQRYFRAAGSLGWAFPAALGAKCAFPDTPVVAFVGDGAFMYHLPELETALRWNLPTITVVNNNSRLAQGTRNVTIAHKGIPGPMEELFTYRPLDFARIAESFGCMGIRVEQPRDIRPALDAALASNRPVVIDIVSDPAALTPPAWALKG